MRNLIIAAAIALTAPLSLGATAEAATKVIIKETTPHRAHRVVERRHRGCVTKRVVTRVRGERIVKSSKVCR